MSQWVNHPAILNDFIFSIFIAEIFVADRTFPICGVTRIQTGNFYSRMLEEGSTPLCIECFRTYQSSLDIGCNSDACSIGRGVPPFKVVTTTGEGIGAQCSGIV